MPTSVKIAETDEGVLYLRGNELVIVDTTTDDPTAIRGVSLNRGPIKLSANYGTDDNEIGFLLGKVDERFSDQPDRAAGQWDIFCRRPDMGTVDAAMVKAAEIQHDRIVVHVPMQLTARVQRFYSDHGRYCYNIQDDAVPEAPHGRIVQYDTHGSTDESIWTPVGVLIPHPLGGPLPAVPAAALLNRDQTAAEQVQFATAAGLQRATADQQGLATDRLQLTTQEAHALVTVLDREWIGTTTIERQQVQQVVRRLALELGRRAA